MEQKPKSELSRLLDRPKHRYHNLIERMFAWLKEKRHTMTRYDLATI